MEILEARVIQKVGTEAEWLANTLPLLDGEAAIVRRADGTPVNLKFGLDGKTFAELPYFIDYSQAAYIAYEATPTQPIAYTFVGEGTYGAITVAEGYMAVLGWDGTSWSKNAEMELPYTPANGVIEEENNNATSGDTVFSGTVLPSDIGLEKLSKTKNVIEELVGSNKDDTNLWGVGYFISNGTISTASANEWRYTKNFYDILPGLYDTHITISGTSVLLYYDENKVLLGSINNTTSPVQYDREINISDSNARYIKFGHNFTAEPSTDLLSFKSKETIINPTNTVFELAGTIKDSDRYFDFLNNTHIKPSESILPVDFLTDYNKYWEKGYISNIGEPTDITWNPVDGFGWSHNLKSPIPLVRGGVYKVDSTMSGSAHCIILNDKLQFEKSYSETSPEVTVDGNIKSFEIDLSDSLEDKYLVLSAHDYNPDTHPTPHNQWFSLMSVTAVNDIFYKEVPSFTPTPINYKHSLKEGEDKRGIKAYDFSGNQISEFGLDNTIYEVSVPSYNKRLRVKWNIEFIEDINIAGASESVIGVIKNYNRSFRMLIHKRNTAVATDNFATYGNVLSQNIRSDAKIGLHYSPNVRMDQTFTSSHIFPWGDFMFGLRYNGDLSDDANRDVCLTITATQFRIWKETGNVTLFSYTITPTTTVQELYDALTTQPFLDLNINSVSNRLAKDLLKISKINLSSEYYYENGTKYWDSGFCWIPYGISERKHTIEVVFENGNLYYSFNGQTWEIIPQYNFASPNTKFFIGGELGNDNLKNRVSDLHVTTEDLLDAEIFEYSLNYPAVSPKVYNKKIRSDYNPCLYAFVGHGVEHTSETTIFPDPITCSTDRLERVFQHLTKEGFVNVSLKQVADWKRLGTPLPKKCFVIIFDDLRWILYANPDIRKVFQRHSVNPVLALITSYVNNPDSQTAITFGGITYNPLHFYTQMNLDHWEVDSHTKDHRGLRWDKRSEILYKLNLDALDAAQSATKSDAIIYPQGNINNSILYTLPNTVFRIGFMTANGNRLPSMQDNDFYLHRVEIGQRNPLQNLLDSIV